MTYFTGYRCSNCGAEYSPEDLIYLCPVCARDYKAGMPLPGILECVYDYEGIARAWAEFNIAFPDAHEAKRMEELCEIFSPVD